MRFINYIILNKPLICNSNAPRIHLKSSSNLSIYWLFCCRISGKDFLFSSCQIFKEKSCHEPERSKIQPDHAVDAQHPPGVIPRTYTKAFQECSREVFCEKDQDHVQDPMAEDPVLYRDLSPVSDPTVHPFPDGPQKDRRLGRPVDASRDQPVGSRFGRDDGHHARHRGRLALWRPNT